jgi:hypothetical protein
MACPRAPMPGPETPRGSVVHLGPLHDVHSLSVSSYAPLCLAIRRSPLNTRTSGSTRHMGLLDQLLVGASLTAPLLNSPRGYFSLVLVLIEDSLQSSPFFPRRMFSNPLAIALLAVPDFPVHVMMPIGACATCVAQMESWSFLMASAAICAA